MAEIALSIAAKLSEVTGSEAVKNVCEKWGYKDELEELKHTVDTIGILLIDAEFKHDDLSIVKRSYLAALTNAFYDAEDLFDELRTLAEFNISGDNGGKIFGKVRQLFSSDNVKLSYIRRMLRRVNEIKEKLIAMADKCWVSVDYEPIGRRLDSTFAEIMIGRNQDKDDKCTRRREDTFSCVKEDDTIIGRDQDKDTVKNMLLDTKFNEDICIISIVGVGGIGKTALTRLLYNDEEIQIKFQLSLWVCLSDLEWECDVKAILCKILEVVADLKLYNSSLELVLRKFQEHFGDQKFLLVLDDVWIEDRKKWVDLKKFLMLGAEGSSIVVTTRSERTARIICRHNVYKLQSLSDEDSWRLFEMMAFNKLQNKQENHDKFVDMGRNIIEKCERNPLAIKVVGSLLYGQHLSKWESVEMIGLAKIGEGSDKIMNILKLSYHHLLPPLKSCFSYCALFPRGYEIDKEMLVSLWMAHEYVVALDISQSVEEASEEYFSILLQRCFFQDVKKDEYGDVMSVKIHNIMHDVVQEVVKEEICIVSPITAGASNLGEDIRHVNIVGDVFEKISFVSHKIRSYICSNREHLLDQPLENLKALRVLDICYLGINRLPHSIDRLLLLRYLKLRHPDLEALPNSITRLYNLETLGLSCMRLREFPEHFSKLVKLRHLDVKDCVKLTSMPMGMDKLTNLRVLPYFMTGDRNSNDELKVMQVLTRIKGGMCIKIRKNYRNVEGVNETGGGYLKSLKDLTNVTIVFDHKTRCVETENVLKKLEPPRNLEGLTLSFYSGTTIPWPAISLPHHLLHIKIEYCQNLQQIPMLSKLPNLKSLKLKALESVEYMENGMSSSNNDIKAVAEFFPSLECLYIINLLKLKGWWKGDFAGMRLRFPRISYLRIENCPNLTSFSPSSSPENLPEHQLPSLCTLSIKLCLNLVSNLVCPPTLGKLELVETSERLVITGEFGKLREMMVDKMSHLKLLPPTNCLTSLVIAGELSICEQDDEEPWKSLSQSLRQLNLISFPRMKSLPKGIRHMTSLQRLMLLQLKNMVELPEWMGCLSSLQTLMIYECPGIKYLPEAIKDLTYLKQLYIRFCPDLIERCNTSNSFELMMKEYHD